MARPGAATPPTNPEAGVPETPGAGADAQYMLTDIDDSSTRKSASAAGTAGLPAVTKTAHDMYLLKAKDSSVSLTQHLNHKVQVTGTVSADSSSRSMPSPTTSATPPPDSPPTTPRDTSSAAGKPATLTVSSITMISATCPTTFN